MARRLLRVLVAVLALAAAARAAVLEFRAAAGDAAGPVAVASAAAAGGACGEPNAIGVAGGAAQTVTTVAAVRLRAGECQCRRWGGSGGPCWLRGCATLVRVQVTGKPF